MKIQGKAFLLTVISILVPVLLFAGQQSLEENSAKLFAKEIDGIGRLVTAIQTTDGNYLTVSVTNLDGIIGSRAIEHTINKLSSSGKSLWKKSFQINGDDPNGYYGYSGIRSIAETMDGYVLAGGNTLTGFDYALGTVMKLDKDGNLLWKKSITAMQGAHTIIFTSVVTHQDGSFTAVGTRQFTSSGFDWCPVVVKFNAAGKVLWTKVFSDIYGFFSSAPAADVDRFLEFTTVPEMALL